MLSSSGRRIAIVGAGPAGLTAARILQMHGIAVSLFEADASTNARDQGGTLDLHADTGQKALKRAELFDPFRIHARYEDQETRLLHHATADILFKETPEPSEGDRPEIDRKVLRDLLLGALEPGTVRWNARLSEVIAEADGRHRLRFGEHLSEPFDLVIGADGAWSRVRAGLSQVQPAHTGITFIELWMNDVDKRHPEIARLIGHGTMFALHGRKGLVAQRNGQGHVRVYAALHAPLGGTGKDGLDPDDPARLRENLKRLFTGWSPQLLALVDQALDVAFVRPIVALPPDFHWAHRRGVTIIGDAAHIMPPVGLGVNLAMLDAADLADMLASQADWDGTVAGFETLMQARAAAYAVEAAEGFAEMFAEDAPRAVLQHMQNRRDPRTD